MKVICIRIELDDEFVARAKARGYRIADMRQAIEQAGLEELQCLLEAHENDDSRANDKRSERS